MIVHESTYLFVIGFLKVTPFLLLIATALFSFSRSERLLWFSLAFFVAAGVLVAFQFLVHPDPPLGDIGLGFFLHQLQWTLGYSAISIICGLLCVSRKKIVLLWLIPAALLFAGTGFILFRAYTV